MNKEGILLKLCANVSLESVLRLGFHKTESKGQRFIYKSGESVGEY